MGPALFDLVMLGEIVASAKYLNVCGVLSVARETWLRLSRLRPSFWVKIRRVRALHGPHIYGRSFFCLALGADLIGRERPSNKVDIAYLYYLPFCMVFTSRDKLHAKTAPLFLNEDQLFVHGDDLKAHLAKLDEHYSRLSDDVKLRGAMAFAHFPPLDGDFLVSKLWDRMMMPGWREHAVKEPKIRSKEEDAEIVAEINELADAPKIDDARELSLDQVGAVVVKSVPVYRGKWRMVPPEAEKRSG